MPNRLPLVLLAMTLAAPIAQAAICPPLEFAEMEAMGGDELLALRCQYSTDMLDIAADLNKGSVAQGQRLLAIASHCADQLTRMDRILGRKHGIKGTAEEVSKEMVRRCRK